MAALMSSELQDDFGFYCRGNGAISILPDAQWIDPLLWLAHYKASVDYLHV